MRFEDIGKSKSAIYLSRADGLTVAEVAFLSGCYDPLYFSRAFHKYTGISPTHWR